MAVGGGRAEGAVGVGEGEPGEEGVGFIRLSAGVDPVDELVGEVVGVVVLLWDGVVPGAGAERGPGRGFGFPEGDAVGVFAFEPDAPVAAGFAVAGEMDDVVEAVVGAVPEAVARVDGGAFGRVFGEGVFDFPDFEVGFSEEGGGVAGFVEGVAEDGMFSERLISCSKTWCPRWLRPVIRLARAGMQMGVVG